MASDVILLVEDNPDDEKLTIRALNRNNISNEVFVARDGVEAMDYVFARGVHADRDVNDLPRLVLLDLKLPKADGTLGVRWLREYEGLTSRSYELQENSRIHKRDCAEGPGSSPSNQSGNLGQDCCSGRPAAVPNT